jgi:hypothetical protein
MVSMTLDGWDCDGSGREKDTRKRRIPLSNNDIAAMADNAPCVKRNNR